MENRQMIISIGREYGSGGHEIAKRLADRFELPLYDHDLLREMTKQKNMDAEKLEKYDELPKNRLFSRTVRGYNNSPEENVANMQFDFLREKAANGDSFVIVGRCAETVLKEYDCLIAFFVLGDMDRRIERIAQRHNVTKEKAKAMVIDRDKSRKAYHNHYSDRKWGDSRNYEISINSRLGIDATADILEDYIRRRIQ